MRYEKQLLAWEVPECPPLEQRQPQKIDRFKTEHYYRFAAQLLELGGEKFLGITVFNMGGGAKFRLWQNKDQQGLQVFQKTAYDYVHTRQPGRMYSGSIDSCMQTGRYWTSNPEILYGTEKDEKTAYAFLGLDGPDVGAALSRFQSRRREEKIKRRDEKEKARIREMFTGIEEPGETFKEWCIEDLLKEARFFFYDYTGRKKQSGICSHCLKRSELEGIRSEAPGICPECGSAVIFKSRKRLERSSFIRRDRAQLLERQGDRLVQREFEVWFRFSAERGIPRKELHVCELQRIFLDGEARRTENFSKEGGTYAVTVDGFHKDGLEYGFADARLCPLNIKQIRQSLGLRAELEKLTKHGLRARADRALRTCRERPEIEFLIKGRFFRLAISAIGSPRGASGQALLKKGRTAAEVLDIPKEYVDTVRAADLGGHSFELVRMLLQSGLRMKAEDMADIQALGLGYRSYEELSNMLAATTVRKALNYIRKQAAMEKTGGSAVLQTWNDYMRMAATIGLDLEDRQISFPKDLRRAHNEAAKIDVLQKNAKLNKAIGKVAEWLEPLSWKFRGISIRPCRSQTEMIHEGQTLHHCVGRAGYAEKMSKRQTAIFLIRKIDEPDIPFVTLELSLKDGHVIQCYAANDRYPGDAVKAFYKKWEAEIVPKLIKKAKTA